MTKDTVYKLDSTVQFLPGVGPKKAEILEKAGIITLEDLIYYLPRRYLDRSTVKKIGELTLESGEVTVIGKVTKAETIGARGQKQRFVLYVADETGIVEAVFFQGVNYWQYFFKEGDKVALSGRVTYYTRPQINHPAVDQLGTDDGDNFWNTGRIISLYPTSEEMKKNRLDSRGIRKIIRTALDKLGEEVSEYIPDDIRKNRQLISLNDALEKVHFPEDMIERDAAFFRFKYEELFFLQLMLAKRYKENTVPSGVKCDKVGDLTRRFVKSLPFHYTQSQIEVLTEIRKEMESDISMNRLVQGDVGSGKTVIALTAVVMAVESRYQAAIMAPTEILAEQHYYTARNLLGPLGITVAILRGSMRKDVREETLQRIASGDIDLVIGTHALIQDSVNFAKLGLVVVDEQHKFGVHQRMKLRDKGKIPNMLVMTATPIPRTLALTLYGDLDVSIIKEGPFKTGNITTSYSISRQRNRIYDSLKNEVSKGRQAYIIYPLVEESENSDLKAAEQHYNQLKRGEFRNFNVGLLHGRMKSEEKDIVMKDFASGKIQILIATTVVEVGVDVPNANFMIIENAERFGLAQLHQLRGRIGRSGEPAYCHLISDPPLSKDSRRRIKALEESNDGFAIAEIDLELRGMGEFFGAKQHGLPELKYTNPITDKDILLSAREDAFNLIKTDPEMSRCPQLYARFCREFKPKSELANVG